MASMPRPRPPHLRLEKTRHGRRVWYLRFGDGPRIRIKGDYGTPEFDAAYQAALRGERSAPKIAARAGSLAWLIARYREVDAWRSLSPATRRQRENIFKNIIRSAGQTPFGEITKAAIVAGRDRRAATPAQARHFLQAMRSAICLGGPVGPRTSTSPPTVFARSARRALRTTARPSPNSRRYLDGPAEQWRRSTRVLPTGQGWRSGRWASSRTKIEPLSPHLYKKCGRKP
jgi:hypothetical protein